MTVNVILLVVGIVTLAIAAYDVGFDAGGHDAIRELFGDDRDFRRYVEFRRGQMGRGSDDLD